MSSAAPGEQEKNLLIWLFRPQQVKGYRHLLCDYMACEDPEKKALFKAPEDKLAKIGPSRSTRLQTAAANNISSKSPSADALKIAGIFCSSEIPIGLSSFSFKIFVVWEFLTACIGPATEFTSQLCCRSWPGASSWKVSSDWTRSNLSFYRWLSTLLTTSRHFHFSRREGLYVLYHFWLPVSSPWSMWPSL